MFKHIHKLSLCRLRPFQDSSCIPSNVEIWEYFVLLQCCTQLKTLQRSLLSLALCSLAEQSKEVFSSSSESSEQVLSQQHVPSSCPHQIGHLQGIHVSILLSYVGYGKGLQDEDLVHTFKDISNLCFPILIDIISCGAIWSVSIQVQLSADMLVSSKVTILLTCISYNAL